MNIVSTVNDWRQLRKSLTQTLGFVPTMGHLHAGHLSLCERAKAQNEIVVVSVFVNPTQFNQQADFDLYPRTLQQDLDLLEKAKIDYVFLPTTQEMYTDDFSYILTEKKLSHELEGEFRPGHFNGMLTIVLKLLNLIQPQYAYFGEKDYQQLLLIKEMVSALFMPITIVGCETIRAPSGLALSSRNSRLNTLQREKAELFARLLKEGQDCEKIRRDLEALGVKVDYIVEKWQRRLAAVWIDDIRLIDNVIIK